MRKRLLAALCCIVMLLPFAASAETALVPQMSAWQLEESASPLRVTASAQMSAWVPFDDTMLEALNTLLSHMSVQVDTMSLSGEKWSKTALLLDSEEAVSLTQRQTENQRLLNASFLPEQTLTSAVDPTALLLGETGVGKDEIARFIHQNSGRSDRRFVPINCGAITESLFESELFGHEGHAFTGAGSKAKPGLLEAADHGTLFLDEVGELSLNMQTKLLHVLQNRSFIRVGGNEPVQVDIRVIAATNCDLKEMVQQKRFREDLYYRLNVIPIHIPPLRERKNDIIPLAQHFLDYYNQKYDFHRKLSPATCFALLNYRWEGNVRQLKNTIEQATIITDTDLIQPESLPMNVAGSEPVQEVPAEAGLNEMLERMELRYLQTFYERYGSIRKAAERLKLPPTTFLRHWERLRQKYGTASMKGEE